MPFVDPALIAPLVMGGVVLVGALVGGILYLAGRRRPQPGLGPVPVPGGGGEWNASIVDPRVRTVGADLAATHGRLRVADGRLTFTPEGATGPAWSVPCREVTVRTASFFSLDGADVELHGAWGVMRCTVSRERINRFVGNDFKTLRERTYGRELAVAMAQQGARFVG